MIVYGVMVYVVVGSGGVCSGGVCKVVVVWWWVFRVQWHSVEVANRYSTNHGLFQIPLSDIQAFERCAKSNQGDRGGGRKGDEGERRIK